MGSSANGIENWRLRAAEQQQTFHTLFSDRKWDKLRKKHTEFRDTLRLKLSFAVFADSYVNLDDVRRRSINHLMEKILHLSGTDGEFIYLGYTYVITYDGTDDGIIPLLRVKCDNDKVYFVEFLRLEVYDNWCDFIKNANCHICYPKNGIYARKPKTKLLLEYRRPKSGLKNFFPLPLPTGTFFPLANVSFSKQAKIDIQSLTTYAIVIKSPTRVSRYFTYEDYLAYWFSINAPQCAKFVDKDSFKNIIAIDHTHVQNAFDIFRTFYDTPYSVNGHFVVIHWMKMLSAIRIVEHLSSHLSNKFLDMMKFIANLSLPCTDGYVEKIVRAFNDNDSYWNSVFNLSSNCSFQCDKEIEFSDKDTGITRSLNLICKFKQNDSVLGTSIEQFIDRLSDTIKTERVLEAKKLGPLASPMISSVKSKLCNGYIQQTKFLRTKLHQKMRGVTKIVDDIKGYSMDVLQIILECVEKVASLSPNSDDKCRKIYEQEFFKFVHKLADSMEGEFQIEDLFLFITPTFVAKCRAFFIEYEARTPITEAGSVFASFIESLSSESVMNVLHRDFRFTRKLSKAEIVSTAVKFYKGMSVRVNSYDDDLNILAFVSLCAEASEQYLDKYLLPFMIESHDIYNDFHHDHHLLIIALGWRFVLNFVMWDLPGRRVRCARSGNTERKAIVFSVTGNF